MKTIVCVGLTCLTVVASIGGCRCGVDSQNLNRLRPVAAAPSEESVDAAVTHAEPEVRPNPPLGPDATTYRAYHAAKGGRPVCGTSWAETYFPDTPCRTRTWKEPKGGEPWPFGYKMGWLALPTHDAMDVAAQLELGTTVEVGWEEAQIRAYAGQGTLITPEMEGWTVVAGSWVLEADFEKLTALVVRLSGHFGEAQAFVTHRYWDYHGWIVARSGKLLRAYAYHGAEKGLVAASGEPLPEEHDFPVPTDGPLLVPGQKRALRWPRDRDLIPKTLRSEADVYELATRISFPPHRAGSDGVGTGLCRWGPSLSLE